MKICYILPWFPSAIPTTPEARQGIFEYRHVKNLSDAGQKFKIVAIRWKGQSEYEKVDENVEVYRIPPLFVVKGIRYPVPDMIRLTASVQRVCGEWDPDVVVFGHLIYLTTLPSLFLRYRIKKPLIVTTDVFPGVNWFFGDRLVDAIGYLYSTVLGRQFLKTSDGIQLLVSGLGRHVESLGGDTSKAFLVNRGVDVHVFNPEGPKDAIRQEFGVEKDDILLLFVGRLDLVKGVPYLLEAAKRLLRERRGVKLLIVGDGSLDPEYRKIADGFDGRIIFAGYRKDVPELMRASDIFVLPSLSEGAANVVMEASASGIAVVATDVGGIPEIVEEGVTGLLVKPKDPDGLYSALCELITDPQLAREMGAAGRERMVSRYGWDVVCRQVDENYHRVIERYTRGRRTKAGG